MSAHKPLPNSVPELVLFSKLVGDVHESKKLRVRIVLKLRSESEQASYESKISKLYNQPPQLRPRQSAELVEEFSPDPESYESIIDFAKTYKLKVIEVSKSRNDIILQGTVRQINAAFRVKLEYFESKDKNFHAHQGLVHLPDGLDEIVLGVLGLNNISLHKNTINMNVGQSGTQNRPVTPDQLKSLYDIPVDMVAKNQKVACIAFSSPGQECGFHHKDIQTFASEALSGSVVNVHEHSAGYIEYPNQPLELAVLGKFIEKMQSPGATIEEILEEFGPVAGHALATIETTMDVELVAAMAPFAEIHVIFTDNSLDGMLYGISKALELEVTSISISWGNNEANWHENAAKTANHLFQTIPLLFDLAPTICCASGDWGTKGMQNEGAENGLANAFFPASSPWVLACGGTVICKLEDGTLKEAVWNSNWLGEEGATGGGVSGIFEKMHYQENANVPTISTREKYWVASDSESFGGRGVPDVAAIADRTTGIELRVGGQIILSSGTSAAAPIWAGFIACVAEDIGFKLGWINPMIYLKNFSEAFNDITEGDNDIDHGSTPFFHAHRGWDGCCGLGSPNGSKLLSNFKAGEKK